MDKYSFCESVYATGHGTWCLRQLTKIGRKCGGGIDTPSLCGHVKVQYGWDLNVPVRFDHPGICPECAKIAKELKD